MVTSYQPVIIIGAPRSGTNMLRDILTEVPFIGTWPCDEINYIWRHGNVRWPNDAIPEERATPEIQRYIRRKFDKIAASGPYRFVIEKTCANSLRVPFVSRILPDAKYIFLYRDGVDAVASTMKRWTGNAKFSYLLKKAKWVPLSDLPFYGFRFAAQRTYKFFNAEKRVKSWGPQFPQMDQVVRQKSLPEACAWQWRHCVDFAMDGLSSIPSERIMKVRYEEFVSDPLPNLKLIGKFLNLDDKFDFQSLTLREISPRSVGKGHKAFEDKVMRDINKILKPTQIRLGYEK